MRNRPAAKQAAAWLALGILVQGSLTPSNLFAQAATSPAAVASATEIALPLPEDRGAAALSQSLKRLNTWASLMIIIAHPDDEDGAMLTYETRGQGTRAAQLTLTRGEGGQNAISADSYDALGLIRTNELLRAGQFYGVKQYWGTEADFGFSKTKEEAFSQWGHDRVLYDAVLAIRRERPLVVVSTFVGGVTDGHGQHQVSAAIAQEAYKAAGDPKVFPDQFALGLRPWSPRAVFSRMPFAQVTAKGIFDYATGKWSPVRFYNYVTETWTDHALSEDVQIPTGSYDPVLGRTYTQIAREGWGEQKSQNGGGNPSLSGSSESEYHRWATSVPGLTGTQDSFFAGIPTGIEGLATIVSGPPPQWLKTGLAAIAAPAAAAEKQYNPAHPEAIAPPLKSGYQATLTLKTQVSTSSLSGDEKANLTAELDLKIEQFQHALALALGLDLQAFTVQSAAPPSSGPFGGGIDETNRSVFPGSQLLVRVHTGNATKSAPDHAALTRVWLQGSDGQSWSSTPVTQAPGSNVTIEARVPENEPATEPYFTRPTVEQPYYDVSRPEWRGRSFAPYPLTAWAEFHYQGLPIRLGETVQTLQRQIGVGGVFEPLVVTPKIGVRISPESQILPLDGSPLPVHVTIHTESAASGKVRLKLPDGWTSVPVEADFDRKNYGDTTALLFEVKPPTGLQDTSFSIHAEAIAENHTYQSGWQRIGYLGLRPYNQYRSATLKTRAIDVKVTPGLKIAYVMGTGDMVPEAIQGLGYTPHLLTPAELRTSDLSAWDVIVLGIRAYSARPELGMVQPRLDAFVQGGGTLIVQYQSNNFPAPVQLLVGSAEKVVEETAPVKLLAPDNSLLTTPNQITPNDFDGWVEERGHSFLDSWDAAYTPLTETADHGQDPQRGGLLVAHPGKGTYIYLAYALYRQLPELVPGSYRILANLLSAGKSSAR